MKKISLIIVLFQLLLSVRAEIKLPAFFASGMVLQQQTSVNVWGKAAPNRKVTLSTTWDKKKYSAMADADGNWKMLVTTTVAGGPYNIVISDGKLLTLNNVMLGEVWLCSGQSNMEMPMKGSSGQPIEGSTMDILKSENAQIRLFTVERKADFEAQTDVKGKWQQANPESVRNFSAAAYYFGRLIQQTLNVPVGLIASSWGGSSIEAWMTEEMLKDFPAVKIPDRTKMPERPQHTPTVLYHGMIHPLVGYNIKGFLWYQGESNRNRYSSYEPLFRTMIDSWRKAWNQSETIPFYYCQIAPYKYDENVNTAFLREAQAKAANHPQVGMAVLMDAGEEQCIHPAKKREAGERLALLAISKTYKIKGIDGESPVFKDIEIKGNEVTVNFIKAPTGVYALNNESKLFMVAGDDKVFYPAKAIVNRTKIVVSSEEVEKPVAVRYAFENFVVGDLFGVNGLPVSSFRSDDW
jgi:sialate O-acetylesterase